MARRIISYTTLTPTAYSDTTDLVNGNYPFFIQGGTTTQQIKIHEISISGQAASTSSPTFMLFARDSQVGTSCTVSFSSGGVDAAMDTATAALSAPPVTGNNATTSKPQRSSTAHLMNCSLNAFGGVYFWRANKWDECVDLVGLATTIGELSLSAFTGGTPGAIGVHAIYEPL